jgi:plastocyanin
VRRPSDRATGFVASMKHQTEVSHPTMRALRPLALTSLALALVLAVAACTGAAEPGWTYAPATPAPPSAEPTAAPSGEPSAAPSDGGGEMVVLDLSAQNIQYDKTELEAPANQPFQIRFANNDAGVPHNVAIHQDSPTGPEVWKGDIFNGVETVVYDVPALPPGTYGFVCTVHPNMTGTLVVR